MQFTETDYVGPELGGVEARIIKTGDNMHAIVVKVTPLTYEEFVATYSAIPSQYNITTLPDAAECKRCTTIYY